MYLLSENEWSIKTILSEIVRPRSARNVPHHPLLTTAPDWCVLPYFGLSHGANCAKDQELSNGSHTRIAAVWKLSVWLIRLRVRLTSWAALLLGFALMMTKLTHYSSVTLVIFFTHSTFNSSKGRGYMLIYLCSYKYF